jgi:hypothetical protein
MVILANAFFGSFPKAVEVKWKANSDYCCRFFWFFKSLMWNARQEVILSTFVLFGGFF